MKKLHLSILFEEDFMDIHYFPEPFPHVIIEKFFEPDELAQVWDELKFLTYEHKLRPPEKTSAAIDENQQRKKKGSGLFLFDAYRDKDTSDIIRCSSKLFNRELAKILSDFNYIFDYLASSNRYGILLNYYQDGDYYHGHTDRSCMSAVITLFREPQKFTGGDLIFPKSGKRLAPQTNRMVIFPGIIEHEVEMVSMEGDTPYSGNGRYSINLFMNYE